MAKTSPAGDHVWMKICCARYVLRNDVALLAWSILTQKG